ncbi:MAG: methylated-DNA--[protein]-cysteine S-methyltransferase [Muribaculaceae bacterium]
MGRKNDIKVCRYDSLCGTLVLGSYVDRLCLCDWQVEGHSDRVDRRLTCLLRARLEEGMSPVLEMAARQLDEYFAGTRREFDVPLLFVGTDFQKKVWNELLKIPFGKTVSYGELAAKIGKPRAVRAVANANGANAMSIFVPCHRVIGSDSSLTGYGGGLEAKKYLLELEHTIISTSI